VTDILLKEAYFKRTNTTFTWRHKRNGSHPDVFKDKMQGLHQSNKSYLF